jgi:hypothetical protein
MQVFVKRGGNGVLDCSFYRVGCHPRAQPFSKARCASPIILWMASQLSHPCARSHAAQRSLSESRLLPVLAVWMRLRNMRHGVVRACQRNSH